MARQAARTACSPATLRWALDRLDEVATAWADSDIPAGRRSTHPSTTSSGSAYIQLSVDRPRDRATEEAIEDYLRGLDPACSLMRHARSAR